MTKKSQKSAKQAKPAKPSKPAKQVKLAKQPTPTKRAEPAKPPTKAYIVFGADEYSKPRAARFLAEDPSLLAQAVEAMCLRLIEVNNEELADIATRLPTGRLHASGSGLVPYIKGELYSDLLTATFADEWPQPAAGPTAQDLPT